MSVTKLISGMSRTFYLSTVKLLTEVCVVLVSPWVCLSVHWPFNAVQKIVTASQMTDLESLSALFFQAWPVTIYWNTSCEKNRQIPWNLKQKQNSKQIDEFWRILVIFAWILVIVREFWWFFVIFSWLCLIFCDFYNDFWWFFIIFRDFSAS